VLLVRTCVGCGSPGPSPCPACVDGLRPPPLLPPPPGIDECHALFAHEGPARNLVAGLKYRNHRAALPGLSRAAGALVPEGVDVITWAPTSPDRRRRRGFDQSELLARAVARQVGVPCRRLLRRSPGPAQTGRSAAERWVGPAFEPSPWRRPAGTVVLVDDVVTTGATVSAAARCLRAAGASRVVVVTLTRTPSSRPRSVTKEEG
jgi:predicted amidophosphoribosyltransferase